MVDLQVNMDTRFLMNFKHMLQLVSMLLPAILEVQQEEVMIS